MFYKLLVIVSAYTKKSIYFRIANEMTPFLKGMTRIGKEMNAFFRTLPMNMYNHFSTLI